MLLFPSIAFADGGGPLLLIINFEAFLYGSIIIILVEWFLYMCLASVPREQAFWDSLIANVLSTLVVGFGFPLAIGLIGLLGSIIPWGVGDISMALGTWVFENSKYPKITTYMTAIWLVLTFFITVRYEAKILRKRWDSRGFTGKITPDRISWYCNSVTYAGLFTFFLFAWVL